MLGLNHNLSFNGRKRQSLGWVAILATSLIL
jgi:hypothetical protein